MHNITPCLVHLEVGQVRLNPPLSIAIITTLYKKINEEKTWLGRPDSNQRHIG